MYAVGIVLLLARNADLFVVAAGGDQLGLSQHLALGGFQTLVLAFVCYALYLAANTADFAQLNLGAETLGLFAQKVGVLQTGDTLRKAGIVIDPIGHSRQTAHYAAFKQYCFDIFASGINCRAQGSWAGANHDNVVDGRAGARRVFWHINLSYHLSDCGGEAGEVVAYYHFLAVVLLGNYSNRNGEGAAEGQRFGLPLWVGVEVNDVVAMTFYI